MNPAYTPVIASIVSVIASEAWQSLMIVLPSFEIASSLCFSQ